MRLTKLERLLLSNQLKILESLYPEDADSYSKNRKAIEEGFALEYESIFGNISDELSREACEEVMDILDMYSAINFSYNELVDKSKVGSHAYLKFRGFDGNNELEQLSYTEYLIINSGRWPELKYDQENPDFNSHNRMLDKYKRMLLEWNKCSKRTSLSENEIKCILEA